jgi:hypothetical protein
MEGNDHRFSFDPGCLLLQLFQDLLMTGVNPVEGPYRNNGTAESR